MSSQIQFALPIDAPQEFRYSQLVPAVNSAMLKWVKSNCTTPKTRWTNVCVTPTLSQVFYWNSNSTDSGCYSFIAYRRNRNHRLDHFMQYIRISRWIHKSLGNCRVSICSSYFSMLQPFCIWPWGQLPYANVLLTGKLYHSRVEPA